MFKKLSNLKNEIVLGIFALYFVLHISLFFLSYDAQIMLAHCSGLLVDLTCILSVYYTCKTFDKKNAVLDIGIIVGGTGMTMCYILYLLGFDFVAAVKMFFDTCTILPFVICMIYRQLYRKG